MTLRVGMVGLGFIGKQHLESYEKVPGAVVVAVADAEQARLDGEMWDGSFRDLTHLRRTTNPRELYEADDLDVIHLNLPTYLHAEHAIAALEAGKHVLCEKPMARTSVEARSMIDAAQRSGRQLFILHCIRFWPPYVKAREIVYSQRYGHVQTARFNRIGALPTWSWKGWLQEPSKSGLAALDFHIHDADFVQYLFGKPDAVLSTGGGMEEGRIDHIITGYHYKRRMMVGAEGAWEYAPGYPGGMSFSIAMERATLVMKPDLSLHLFPWEGEPEIIALPEGDGYDHELRHFVECMARNAPSDICPPESSWHTMKLIEAEIESVQTRQVVPLRY